MFDKLNLGELAQPFTEIISLTGNGIGRVYNDFVGFPRVIKNMKIAHGLEVSFINGEYTVNKPLEQLNFVEHQEFIKFKNQFEIVHETLKKIQTDTENGIKVEYHRPDDDWTNIFLENSKYISNKDLKELWTNLLKSKLTSKQVSNKRTLEIMKNFSSKEVEFLTALRPFVCEPMRPILPVENEFDDQSDIKLEKLGRPYLYGYLNGDNKIETLNCSFKYRDYLNLSNLGIFQNRHTFRNIYSSTLIATNKELFYVKPSKQKNSMISNEGIEIFNLIENFRPNENYTTAFIKTSHAKHIPKEKLNDFCVRNGLV